MGLIVWGVLVFVGLPNLDAGEHSRLESQLRNLKEQETEFMERCQDGTRTDIEAPDQPRTKLECSRFWVKGNLQSVFPQVFLMAGIADDLSRVGSLGFLLFMVLGASYLGADWQSGQFGLLVQWEPRRVRVFLVKQSIVVTASFLCALGFAVALTTVALPAAVFRGSFAGVDQEWLLGVTLIVARLGVSWSCGAAVGACLAFLGRRTITGVGAGIVYLLSGLLLPPILGVENPFNVFESVDWFVATSTGFAYTYSTGESAGFLAAILGGLLIPAFVLFRTRDIA